MHELARMLARMLDAANLHLRRPINHVLPPSLLLYLVPPLPPLRLVLAVLVFAALVWLRVWLILPARNTRPPAPAPAPNPAPRDPCTVAVFLGSGGHTTELLQLVNALPPKRYTHRIYLVSSADPFSLQKAQHLERTLRDSTTASSPITRDHAVVTLIQIPRARSVHQSFLTTPLSFAKSIAFCIHHVALAPLCRPRSPSRGASTHRILADVVLMNGPGTCVPIVVSVYLLRIFGLASPKLVYIESFARVNSLSLTAKFIRPFVDRFVLQWPRDVSNLPANIRAKALPNTVYAGWLV